MKNTLIFGALIIIFGIGTYFILTREPKTTNETPITETPVVTNTTPQETTTASTTETVDSDTDGTTIIGSSSGEHDIAAYHYGTGDTEVLFVGGIHGGYSWNTTLVAYELMNYLEKNPTAIPEGVKVTVIPVLNPDGLTKIVGTTEAFSKADVPQGVGATIPGRFNDNDVDLNRNFDCDWKATGTWQNRTVSGGSKAFSEPESQAFRDYVTDAEPSAVVVWYSAAGGVYSSNCHNGVLPETKTLTNIYAQASEYPAHESFDYYEITGDAVNWLAKIGVPAISVLLTTHEDTEWEKNKAGIEAVLKHYAQ